MTVRAARLLALAPALWAAAVTSSLAAPFDVSGNWQANIDCDLTATASVLFHLDEDSATGAVTASMTNCGTFEVPGAIRRPLACVLTPGVLIGQVDRQAVDLPATDYYLSDATVPAYPFLSCTAATEILSSHHLHGVVSTDDAGHVIGLSGTWANGPIELRDATGTTCWSLDSAPTCSLDMRRNDVPAGADVTVSPRDGVTVTFQGVTTPGVASVMPLTDADASIPSGFQVLGSGNVPVFYDVHTTATFSGTVTTCFSYTDADGDGIVDGSNPPLDETALRVLHAENGMFVDRTSRLDTTAKVVCGATESLSQLVVAHPPGTTSDSWFYFANLRMRRRRSGKATAQFLSDASFTPPVDAADDPLVVGATFEIFSKTDPTVARFEMPAAGWRKGRRRKWPAYRFRNPSAPNATSPVARALLTYGAPGFRIVSRSLGLALAQPQQAVSVRLTVGTRRWCEVFDAPTTDRPNRFVASGYGTSTLDCGDKRILRALGR